MSIVREIAAEYYRENREELAEIVDELIAGCAAVEDPARRFAALVEGMERGEKQQAITVAAFAVVRLTELTESRQT